MADEQTVPRKHVAIEELYLKKLSFVSSKTPDAFAAYADAEKLLNIRSTNSQIASEHIEVTLIVGVRAVARDDTIFQIEVVQAGVFMITGYTPEELMEILGRVCPETLFPFARNTILETTRKAGFPNVLLEPLDFDALFAKNMRERAAQSTAT